MQTKSKNRAVLALLMLLSIAAVTLPVVDDPEPAAAADIESVDVGMPFTGKWAYNVLTTASCGEGNSETAHPSCHHTPGGGHWGTDLYAADNTAVVLRLSNATGALSFEKLPSTNGDCGSRLVFKIKVDDIDVGKVYYDHLKSVVGSSADIYNGATLGRVDQTCHATFPHVHVEYTNLQANHSCYVNHSTTANTAGMQLNDGTLIGKLGSSNTGTREACGEAVPQNPIVGSTSLLSIARNADGRLEIFAVGTDNKIYAKAQTAPNVNDWNPWYTIPAGAKSVATASQPDGRIALFYVGGDGALYYRYQTAPNSGWTAERRMSTGFM